MGPQSFRVGDIVAIQVSFVVIPLKGEKRKMLSILRTVTLIDGTFSKVKADHITDKVCTDHVITLNRAFPSHRLRLSRLHR